MKRLLNAILKRSLSLILVSGLIPGFLKAQSKYDQFNVIRVLSYAPRAAKCYNPTPGIGYYGCIEIPMGVLIRQANGKEASVCCTSYKLDGSVVENVKRDFGSRSKDGFTALKNAIGTINLGTITGLDPSVQEKLKSFRELLDHYKDGIDVEGKPEDLLNYTATAALYELTEAFMQSDANINEKLGLISQNQNVSTTLFEISSKGILNVSTSLLPFVSDARDLYEMVNGKDLITGEEIDGFGRVVSGVALIAGSGSLYRKAVDKLKDSFFKKAVTEAAAGIPALKYTGAGGWVSDAGLVYRKALKKADGTVRYENNLRHVLRHATANPADVKHTVFNLSPREVPRLIDEAWLKKGAAVTEGGIDIYLVPMGKAVGTKGEKSVRIVVEKSTANIISAYPI